MKRYGHVYDPGSNAKGVDTSCKSNPAPQGPSINSSKKRRIRRAAKSKIRQQNIQVAKQEMTLAL